MDKAEIALLSLIDKQDLANLYISVYRAFKELRRKHKLLSNKNFIATMTEENRHTLHKRIEMMHFRISNSRSVLKKECCWNEEFNISERLFLDLIREFNKYLPPKKENKENPGRKEIRKQKMNSKKNLTHHYKKVEYIKRKKHVDYGQRSREPW